MSLDLQHGILVSTLVSAQDASGRVQIEGPSINIQLSVNEARSLAESILQAATFAEADAFLLDWVVQSAGVDAGYAVALLREFRQYREARVARPIEGSEPAR